ncbi:MAG: hypothetical protein HYV26_14625 [Candidatus Hydrogenedentes bacterium]|nr:hypothetical protein [Candidatus Hydrogenedentota bacterium]
MSSAACVLSKFTGCMVILFAASAQAATVTIADDRMLVVDGKRTFVLGLYENPQDDAVLRAVKEAGFNLVYSAADAAALDRLHAAGLYAWINTGANIDLSQEREQRERALTAMAQSSGKHPALIVWEVPDEALWNNWYSAIQARWEREPGQLRQKIAEHPDAAAAQQAREKATESERLRHVGDYAASEAAADAAWKLLGVEPPHAGFGVANAAERSAKMLEGMRAGYTLLKSLDPAHPVWMNHAPRNQIAQLLAYGTAADIAGCDIYPVPGAPYSGHSDLADQTTTAVGAYTDRMQAGVPGKPVWMVLQGFGWADLEENPSEESRQKKRRPTLEETRFMAYDAIAHGARGLLYWGTFKVEKDSAFWQDLLTVVQDLSKLQDVLAAPDATMKINAAYAEMAGSIESDPIVLAKEAPSGIWLLLVNENPDPLRFQLTGLNALEGRTYADHYKPGSTHEVRQGKIDTFVAAKSFVLLAPR